MRTHENKQKKFIADHILANAGCNATLLGGQTKDTGKVVFPMPQGLEADRYEEFPLKRQGTLWTYTIQRFPPKSPYIGEKDPAKFRPFAVGYVELDDQLIVEARLDVEDFDTLEIGQKMELTVIEFARSENGEAVYTFAFKPV